MSDQDQDFRGLDNSVTRAVGPTLLHTEKSLSHRKSATRRSARTIAGVLGFMVLFAILVIMVSKFYLIPGLAEAQHSTHAHKRKMAAEALLVLSVMLTILLVGLLVTFRISRFFFPPPSSARTRTKVVDAWAEAGKRIENKEEEGDID